MEWIMLKDKLPEDGTWNIFTDGTRVSIERFKEDAIDHFYPNGRWFELEDAIAWIALPYPLPKKIPGENDIYSYEYYIKHKW